MVPVRLTIPARNLDLQASNGAYEGTLRVLIAASDAAGRTTLTDATRRSSPPLSCRWWPERGASPRTRRTPRQARSAVTRLGGGDSVALLVHRGGRSMYVGLKMP